MYCRFCGKQIPDNSQFCEHCGRSLRSAGMDGWRPSQENGGSRPGPEQPPVPERNSRRNVIIAACAGGVVLLALVVALVLLFVARDSPEDALPGSSPESAVQGDGGAAFGPEDYYLGDAASVYLEDGSVCAALSEGVYRFTSEGAERLLAGNYNGTGICVGEGELLAVRRVDSDEHILVELDLESGETDELYSCPGGTVLAGKLGDTLYLLAPGESEWGMDLISIEGDGTQTPLLSNIGRAKCGPFGILVEGFRSDVGPRELYVLSENGSPFRLSENCLASSQSGGKLLVWECNASASNDYIWDEITLVDYSGNGGVQRLSIGCSGASAVPMTMFAQGSAIQSFGGEANILWVDYAGEYWFKAPLTEDGDALAACFPDGDALYGYCYSDRRLYQLHLNMDAGKVEMDAVYTMPEDCEILAVTDGVICCRYSDNSRDPMVLELAG